MDLIKTISTNILIVVLTIAALLACLYIVLLVFDRVLKLKSGGREHEGLTAMLVDSMKHKAGGEVGDEDAQEPEAKGDEGVGGK